MFSEDDLKPGTRLVPYTLQYLQDYNAGKNVQVPSFSAGLQTRQFITLEEMIQTVDKAVCKYIVSDVYNMGGGEFLSIRHLIEVFLQSTTFLVKMSSLVRRFVAMVISRACALMVAS